MANCNCNPKVSKPGRDDGDCVTSSPATLMDLEVSPRLCVVGDDVRDFVHRNGVRHRGIVTHVQDLRKAVLARLLKVVGIVNKPSPSQGL